MPEQSESHNRKGAFLKRRDPFSGMCCTNTTPHSRTSIQSRFIQQYEPRCFAGSRHSQRRLRARATRVLGTCGPTAALECLLAPRPSQACAPARCRSHHPFVPAKAGTQGNSLRHLDSGLRGNERRRAARRKEAPAVGDLTAGVLYRRSSCRGLRVNRDSQTLMCECPTRNYRRLKFCRRDISAATIRICSARTPWADRAASHCERRCVRAERFERRAGAAACGGGGEDCTAGSGVAGSAFGATVGSDALLAERAPVGRG